eukprot:UN06425
MNVKCTNKKQESFLSTLEKLSAESNISFCSSDYDTLRPLVMYNYGGKIIPIKTDIMLAIKASKCPLGSMDCLIRMLVDFIMTDDENSTFSTRQFLEILCYKNHIHYVGYRQRLNSNVWRLFQLNNAIIKETDKRRKPLNINNLNQLDGFYIPDPTDDDFFEINYDFIQMMKDHLLDVSIITVSTD